MILDEVMEILKIDDQRTIKMRVFVEWVLGFTCRFCSCSIRLLKVL